MDIRFIINICRLLKNKTYKLKTKNISFKIGCMTNTFLSNLNNKINQSREKSHYQIFARDCIVLYFHSNHFKTILRLESMMFKYKISKYIKFHTTLIRIYESKKESYKFYCNSSSLSSTLLLTSNSYINKIYESFLELFSKINLFTIYKKSIVVFKCILIKEIKRTQNIVNELSKKEKIYA